MSTETAPNETNESAATPVWTDDRLAVPHEQGDKAQRVNAMFAAIADSYDLNNRVHSLGRDQAWRRKAVRLAKVRAGQDHVVDVACGTGDLTFAFADANPASVLGIDFTPRMLEIARVKDRDRSRPDGEGPVPEFRVGDAMDLQLPDASADIVSIAFGIRNVSEPAQALREFRRILRPGGRLVILEFSVPRNPLLRAGYNFYFHHVMPRTATWVSGDRSGAYKYLPRSVATFIDRDTLQAMMADAGFTNITAHAMTFGICVAYVGHLGP